MKLRTLLLALPLFLAACGGGGEDAPTGNAPSSSDRATIQVAIPQSRGSLAPDSLYPSRAAGLPEGVDQIRVTIFSLLGEEIATGRLDANGGTLSFSLPPYADYTVVVEALFTQFPPTEVLYRGSADVDRLAPGESRTVSVLMDLLVRTQLIAPISSLPVGGPGVNYRFDLEELNNSVVRWLVNGIEGGDSTVGTIVDGLYTPPASVPPNPIVVIRAEPQHFPRFGEEVQLLLLADDVLPGAPNAVDDHFEIEEDTTLANNLLGNDIDPDGLPLSLITTPVSPPAHGSLVLSANGDFTYTPQADFNGNDNFVYAVKNTDGDRSQAKVHIVVTPVNDPPTANDDEFFTLMGETLTGNLLGNNGNGRDSDPDGDELTVVDVQNAGGSRAMLNVNPDGSFAYTAPNAPAPYTDSFYYTVSDPDGETDSAYVDIKVNATQGAPVAVDDRVTIPLDGDPSCDYINVLANDHAPNGAALIVSEVSVPQQGSTAIVGNHVEYCRGGLYTDAASTPRVSLGGTSIDTFEYSVTDGNQGTDSATVKVDLKPRANDDKLSTNASHCIYNLDWVLATNDYHTSDFDIEYGTPAGGGTIGICDGVDCYCAGAASTSDSFQYTLTHVHSGESDSATVQVDVAPAPPTLTAMEDQFTLPLDANPACALIDVLSNDSSPSDSPLAIISITTPQDGSATIVGKQIEYCRGSVPYDVRAVLSLGNAMGGPSVDFFEYTMSDDINGTDSARVKIDLQPQANDDNLSTNANDCLYYLDTTVLGNDNYAGDYTINYGSPSAGGTIGACGGVSTNCYCAPASGATDQFQYTLSHITSGRFDTATVKVDLNNNPVAVNTSTTMSYAGTTDFSYDVEANGAYDPDAGDTIVVLDAASGDITSGLSFSGTTLPFPKSSVMNSPALIDYTIGDNKGGFDTGQITVNVQPQAADDGPFDATWQPLPGGVTLVYVCRATGTLSTNDLYPSGASPNYLYTGGLPASASFSWIDVNTGSFQVDVNVPPGTTAAYQLTFNYSLDVGGPSDSAQATINVTTSCLPIP